MRKFTRVSLCIFTIVGLFLAGIKIFFSDMIHSNDYEKINRKEINMVFESKEETKDGVYLKFRVINNSRYVFLLTNAKIEFPSYNSEGGLDLLLELNVHNQYKDQNEKIMDEGIAKYGEGYITFLVPKGIKLDNKYFDLDAISIQYQGVFKVKLPFLNNKYLVISNYNGRYLLSSSKEQVNFK